jgi:hypothetical protein
LNAAPEPSGVFKIIVFAAVGREYVKDNSYHGHLGFAASVGGISSLRFGQDV